MPAGLTDSRGQHGQEAPQECLAIETGEPREAGETELSTSGGWDVFLARYAP